GRDSERRGGDGGTPLCAAPSAPRRNKPTPEPPPTVRRVHVDFLQIRSPAELASYRESDDCVAALDGDEHGPRAPPCFDHLEGEVGRRAHIGVRCRGEQHPSPLLDGSELGELVVPGASYLVQPGSLSWSGPFQPLHPAIVSGDRKTPTFSSPISTPKAAPANPWAKWDDPLAAILRSIPSGSPLQKMAFFNRVCGSGSAAPA